MSLVIETSSGRRQLTPSRIARLSEQFIAEPAYQHVGMNLVGISYGHCTAEVPINCSLLHHRGAVQGGILAMIADATAGYAALAVVEDDEPAADMATLEFKTSFFEPAVGRTLRCRADALRTSRHIVFCRALVWSHSADGNELLCAEATLTFKRLGGVR